MVERYRLLDYNAAKEAEERSERASLRIPVSAFAEQGFARDPEYKGKGVAA